jgi:hypothetical protein
MIHKLKFAFAIVLFAAAQGYAQEKESDKPARQTAEATWPEGKLTITYGAPAWKDEFKDQMTGVWRLGKDQPTSAKLTAGLESTQGAIPPGDYTIALRATPDKKWNLLFYEANAFYDEAFKTWEIEPTGPTTELKTPASKLNLRVEGKNLTAEFGPMSVTWALKPIKVNPPIETEFANYQSKFEILALPLAGTTFKDTLVGVATTSRDNLTVRYHIRLTVEGDKATLNLVNERAAGIAKEKAQIEDITKRISEFMEKVPPERKPQMEAALASFKGQLDNLEAMSKAYERLNASQSVTGTVTKREQPAMKELGIAHDRPTGAIVLKFALENSDAAFEIKPGPQFRKRRGE